MSKSDFDKNGVDKSGTHWLQYAALAVSAFAVYTTWAYYNDTSFHSFVVNPKISTFTEHFSNV